MPQLRILLVEDEPALLQLLAKYLRRLGHEVACGATAAEALEKFGAAPEKYDLAIADLGMPDIPGMTLLFRLIEIKRDLRILICSGSPFSMSTLPAELQQQIAFLQKPFVPKMLADALDGLMSSGTT